MTVRAKGAEGTEVLVSNHSAGRRWRLLLADDHKPMLASVKELLRVHYDVVGMACDGETLLDLVAKLEPDIAVIDISMPGLNGMAAARCLKDSGTRTKLIFLTIYANPEFVRAAFAVGALGYVLKRCMVTDLPLAIEAALAGKRFLSTPLAESHR
jgi:DNA-binding NarL/FixJ family response regulator